MRQQIRYTKAAACARDLLFDTGFDNLLNYPLDLFANGLGATVIFKPLLNSDGRIIFGKRNTVIEVNSNIEFEEKKSFTLAHELGHLIMHKGIELHNDDDRTLTWFNDKEKHHRSKVENEANQFASELLMPSDLFIEKQEGEKFSPDLLRKLAGFFKTSLTSVAFKYLQLGNHPICLFHSRNGKVSYWKRQEEFPHYIVDRTKLNVPNDSVANEFYEKQKIYSKTQSKQPIWKSTWFKMNNWESDNDYNFFEYAIVTPAYDTVLSVVWEE